jgi:acetyl esterase/lipase
MSWQNHRLRLAQYGFRAFNSSPRLDVAQERRNLAMGERLFRPDPALSSSTVSANGGPAEWVIPNGRSTERVIMYAHGGGFYSGTLAGARRIAGKFALAAHARALTFDYRLAPEHPFPAALEDTRRTYDGLLASGVSSENTVLIGDSAGGNLVLALWLQLRDAGRPLPRCAVGLSPATDLTLAGDTWARNARADLLLNPAKVHATVDLYLRGADPR